MNANEKAGPHHETGPHTNAAADQSNPDPSAVLAAATGYCVIVESNHGKYRRRLYLSLSAAENAVARANANGKWAGLVLARVVPVGVVA